MLLTYANLISSAQALLTAALVVVAADLVIALAHWSLDRYGNPSNCLLGKRIFRPNREHHAYPNFFLRHSALTNSAETIPLAAAVIGVAWALDILTWEVALFFIAIGSSAIFHRLLHLPRDRVCLTVRILQGMRILQSRQEHREHHFHHTKNYAVLLTVTNWLLESSNAFRWLERAITVCGKCRPFDLAALSREARRQRHEKR